MKKHLSILSACLLAGCASPNVALKPSFWKNHKQKIAVTTTKPAKVSLYKTGSQGLVDMAISQAETDSFTSHLNKTKLGSFNAHLVNDLLTGLHAKHIHASSAKPFDISKLKSTNQDKQHYSVVNVKPLRISLGNKKLLYIEPLEIGATRNYYAFIPLGPPQAICALEGDLVNTKNNKILWRYHTNVTVPVKGEWDQEPNYPNFTKALHKALHLCRKEMVDNFLYSSNS